MTEDGFVETLSLLIKRTIEENNKKSESKSVIHESIEGIDLRDKYGDTGWYHAPHCYISDEMRGYTYKALHYAVARANNRGTSILLERGADVNAQNNHRITPLHLAAKNGDIQILEQLISFRSLYLQKP